MCIGSKVPAPPPPPQEMQSPDTTQLKRKNKPAGMGGSYLGGPAATQPSTLNTGSTTLLGG